MGGRGTLGLSGLVRLAVLLVAAGVLWGVGAAVAGYHLGRTARDTSCGTRVLKVAFLVSMYKTEPCVTTPIANGMPCSVYVDGHDALVVFSGPDSVTECTAFVRANPNGSGWTRAAHVNSASLVAVCNLVSADGRDSAGVTDSGSAIYGNNACNHLIAQGWKAKTS